MRTSEFDFALPDELIAQYPVEPRDRSRLMVIHRQSERWEHLIFADLPDLLGSGDVLVRNNTRVVPARLVGTRESTGGRWEGLFLRELQGGEWAILATTRGRPQVGESVVVGHGLRLILRERGGRPMIVQPESVESALCSTAMDSPLPPTFERSGRTGDRALQALYAEVPEPCSPTAAFHGELL